MTRMRLALGAAVVLAAVVAPVALGGSGDRQASASASVKKQVTKLKQQVNQLKQQVEDVSKLPGPQGPKGEQGEQGPPGRLARPEVT